MLDLENSGTVPAGEGGMGVGISRTRMVFPGNDGWEVRAAMGQRGVVNKATPIESGQGVVTGGTTSTWN